MQRSVLTNPGCWVGSGRVRTGAGTGRRLSWRPSTLRPPRSGATSWRSNAKRCLPGPGSPSWQTRRAPAGSSPRTSRPAARPDATACTRSGPARPCPPGSRTAFLRCSSDGRVTPSPEPTRPCYPVRWFSRSTERKNKNKNEKVSRPPVYQPNALMKYEKNWIKFDINGTKYENKMRKIRGNLTFSPYVSLHYCIFADQTIRILAKYHSNACWPEVSNKYPPSVPNNLNNE